MHFATGLTPDNTRNFWPGQHLRGDRQVWLFALPVTEPVETSFADVAFRFIGAAPSTDIRLSKSETPAVGTRGIQTTARAARGAVAARSALVETLRSGAGSQFAKRFSR